jgi:hypothetical protein
MKVSCLRRYTQAYPECKKPIEITLRGDVRHLQLTLQRRRRTNLDERRETGEDFTRRGRRMEETREGASGTGKRGLRSEYGWYGIRASTEHDEGIQVSKRHPSL